MVFAGAYIRPMKSKTIQQTRTETGPPPQRLETLVDGIFAIAMTLLVLGIDVPTAADAAVGGLWNALAERQQQFYNYALSFVLLANFWTAHHRQSRCIRRTDTVHLWINIALLLFICLVPFSTALSGNFPGQAAAKFVFHGNILAVSLMFLWNWAYAIHGRRLVDEDIDPRAVRFGRMRLGVAMVACLAAIGLTFADPGSSSYAYLLMPIGMIGLRRLLVGA